MIENFIKQEMPQKINLYLENIFDIEKIIRKMEISIVNPFEIAQLFKSLKSMISIFEIIIDQDMTEGFDNISIMLENSSKFIKEWESKFDIEQMEKINFVNYLDISPSSEKILKKLPNEKLLQIVK